MSRQSRNSKPHIAASVSVLALAAFAQPVRAQLATSPSVELPEVTILDDQGKADPLKPRRKAPSAAQLNTTPEKRAAKPRAVEQDVPATDGSAAGAPSSDGTPESDPDGDTTVSATGSSRDVSKAASSVTIVTAAEIDARQSRTLSDVLRNVPGLNVVQTGGPGGLTSVFMRGTNSNHTKFIIDGIDVSDPSTSRTFDVGGLLTSDIERVEVLRGPQSGLYGADALGGVIVVHTKKGEGPPKATATVEGGSFGTFNQTAGIRGSSGPVNYALHVGHYRASDVPVTPSDILLPGAKRFNNDYENLTLSGKFGYAVSADVDLNFVARYVETDLLFTNSLFATAPRLAESEQFYSRSEAVWRTFGGRATHIFGFNYTDVKSDSSDSGVAVGFSDGERLKGDWRSSFVVSDAVTFLTGADYQVEKADNSGSSFRGAEEWNRGAYAQVETEPFRNATLVGNVRYDDNENFGGFTTWRVASSYKFDATGTKLLGSVGKAFKAPTLNDRFAFFPGFPPFFPDFVGNPDLLPEESLGYDVGFEQSLLADKFRFGATYFNNDITNLIDGFFYDPVRNVSTTVNFGSARTEGVEVFASADVTDDVRVRADYTLTEATNQDTGAELLRRPKHKATLAVGWTPIEPLLITTSIVYIGDTKDVDRVTFATVHMPAYTLVNVAADYRVNENMSLFGRIDNLFDKDYQNPNGFEGTGFGAFAGVKFNN